MRILGLQTDSHPDSLSDARRRVRDAVVEAGLHLEPARNLEVAVGEVLSNVYQHAYARGVGPVFVEVHTSPGAFVVVVRDEGRTTSAPVIPETLPSRSTPGGRGLYLVEHLVDDVEIRVNPGGHGVAVRMTTRARGEETGQRDGLT